MGTMTGKVFIGAIVALSLLVVAAPADAWMTPRLERAQRAALAWWGEKPACGQIEHVRGETEDLPAWYDLDALDANWAGVGDEFTCQIFLRRSWLKPRPRWAYFCVLYLHEYGHVLGWRDPVTGSMHSDDPRSIMHVPPTRRPRVCR
jgi:hypothetical protein